MKKISQLELPWYTEGPVADEAGDIYFTTLGGGTIMRIDPEEGVAVDWAMGYKPNGQIILKNGDHLICDSGNASVSRYDREGNFMAYEVVDMCAGEKIYTPNDLVADRDGGVYFTDSIRHTGNVFYYGPDGVQRVVAENLDFPNGIALSADENWLFIAESYQNRILCMPINTSGLSVGKWEVFATLPQNNNPGGYHLPDGIKFHQDGTLWVAHYGMEAVQVLDANGKLVESIAVDFRLPSNLFLLNDQLIVTGGHGEPGPGGVLAYRNDRRRTGNSII